MKSGKFRLRKTSDVNQESAIYEIVDEQLAVLLDVTRTDTGAFQVCIIDNQGEGRMIELSALLDLVQEAKRKIETDE
jgi:hypothetical protein